MCHHIGTLCYVVVQNFHGLIFQVHNQIITINMLSPQYFFMIPFKLIKTFQLFASFTYSVINTKLYTRKELVMMES